jgi:CRP-like cAMP-binding protein
MPNQPAMKMQYPECQACKCLSSCFFKSSSQAEVDYLNDIKSCRLLKKNQVIYMEGEKPQGIFCIASGKVKISKINKEGKEQIVRILKAGDNIGYHAILMGENYTDSSIAIEDTQICFVPRQDFMNLFVNNSSINRDVLTSLSNDLNGAEELIRQMAFKSVRERMAEAFLILKKAYNHTDNSELHITISRGDLASLVGTAKETVTRYISEFKEDNIIALEGKDIHIKDWEKLKKISQMYD